MPNPQKSKLLLIGFAILLPVLVFSIGLAIRHSRDSNGGTSGPEGGQTTAPPSVLPSGDGITNPANHRNLGLDLATATPTELLQRAGKALQEQDMETFLRLMGGQVNDKSLEQLKQHAIDHQLKGKNLRVREVGETALNQGARWALEYDREDGQVGRIYFDLKRRGQGWAVEKIALPEKSGGEDGAPAVADSLGTAEAFLLAIQAQRFESAMGLADSKTISDARIAGMCILFEEGEYRLRENKPVRAMFQREGLAGYLATVVAVNGGQESQFTLTVQRNAAGKWQVAEINLDRLLVDYAARVADGDVYYSPLVKNPTGGDTLALYFGFDEDEINPRTRRQLEIVTQILKSDAGKKLTLSGHTDALGTDDYNQGLSSRRAAVVRDFLIKAGVDASQIVSVAKGASQPRRPNVTEAGKDDPLGRRANRRTEIYLDF